MKIFAIVLLLFVANLTSANDIKIQKQLTIEARVEMKKLGGKLKQVLQTKMKTAGPVAAVEACRIEAPLISKQLSTDSDWQVERTSLKVRNRANSPDIWEQKILELFEQKRMAGVNPASLEFSEIVVSEEGRQFRYMKAIGTKKVCVVCHGGEIPEPVAKKIHSLYPEDQAIGYKQGDLRGAFTLSKSIP